MRSKIKTSRNKRVLSRVKFVCSWVYYRNWLEWIRVYPTWASKPTPSWKEVLNYSKKIEKKWRGVERKILQELSKLSGLEWQESTVLCYLVGRCRPFSDPLTMHVSYKKDEEFIDVLTHEMIHQLFIQGGNLAKSKKAWEYIDKKYKDESITTRIHIPLHALHADILVKLFGEKRLKEEIKWSKHPDYKKSWQIVERDGYKNIIREFASRVV